MPYVQPVDGSGRPVGAPRYCVVEIPRQIFELDAVDTQRHPAEVDGTSSTARMLASMEPLHRCRARELTPPWSTPSTSLDPDTVLNPNAGVLPRAAYPDDREYSYSTYNRYRTRQQYDRELVNSLPPLPWRGNRSLRSPGHQRPRDSVAKSSRAIEAVGDVRYGGRDAGSYNRRKGPISMVAGVVRDLGRRLKRAWREKAQR